MSRQFIRDIGIGLILVISQVLFFQHLTIFGTIADPVIFYILWLVRRHDRLGLLFIAALLGIIQDAFFDLWGLNMFTKVLLTFTIYNVIKRRIENQLILWQVLIIVFTAALYHNIIFYSLASFFDAYATETISFFVIIGSAIYTSIAGGLFYIFKSS